jgi:hypothetical protein
VKKVRVKARLLGTKKRRGVDSLDWLGKHVELKIIINKIPKGK